MVINNEADIVFRIRKMVDGQVDPLANAVFLFERGDVNDKYTEQLRFEGQKKYKRFD